MSKKFRDQLQYARERSDAEITALLEEAGAARPKAVARVDLAKNGLPVATPLAVASLLSGRLDQQMGLSVAPSRDQE